MIKELLARIANPIRHVETLLEAPRENAQELVVILGILLTFVFIVVIAAALLISTRRTRAARPADGTVRVRSHRKAVVLSVLITLLIGVFVSGGSYGLSYVSQPKFCASCHSMNDYVQSWKDSSHSKVGCQACHHQPGALGFLADKLEDIRYLPMVLRGEPKGTITTVVTNQACRRCHEGVYYQTKFRGGILVSHSEFLEKGAQCVECHDSLVHPGRPISAQARMGRCVTCHDGEQASRDCKLCHMDPTSFTQAQLERFGRADVDVRKTCAKCHEEFSMTNARQLAPKICTQCHIFDFVQMALGRHEGEWAMTVNRMRGKGCAMSDEEATKIIAYLERMAAQNRVPPGPGGMGYPVEPY